jgi:hypothetical protein
LSAMQIDATFLLAITSCTLILLTEDRTLGLFSRPAVALVGALSFAQALWLLGIWIPGASGFPWPRLALDGGFALAAILRTATVLKEYYRSKAERHRAKDRQPSLFR